MPANFSLLTDTLFNRMTSHKATSLLVALLIFMSFTFQASSFAEPFDSTSKNNVQAKASNETQAALARVQRKQFRQALFYYYQQQPDLALQQLSYNRFRLPHNNFQADLFEAGLQIKLGLPQQAQITLQSLLADYDAMVPSESDFLLAESSEDSVFLPEQDILVIALLQLAEQKQDQGSTKQARSLLTRIKHVPSAYYSHYKLLSQLIYWPEKAPLTAKKINNEIDQPVIDSPFLLLNKALRLIEKKQYRQASELLIQLQAHHNILPTENFWLALFNKGSSVSRHLLTKKESQALSDYAQLLIAQNHVIQGQYKQALDELADFPERSAYGQQALFLFAYSALNAKNYQQAKNIFTVLAKTYPYSDVAWQTIGLLARQYNEQGHFDLALSQYLVIEQRYQALTAELNTFEKAFAQQQDFLSYSLKATHYESENEVRELSSSDDSPDNIELSTLKVTSQQEFQTAQPWLKKALKDKELNNLFQQLLDLKALQQQLAAQQLKHQQFDYTLELNLKRKQQLVAHQQQAKFTERLNKLSLLAKSAEQQLSEAKLNADGVAFANEQQKNWLSRITKSRKIINAVTPHKKAHQVADYQERLDRVAGVLAWQLKLKNSERQWQQQSAFNEVNKLIISTKAQLKQVNRLMNNDRSLAPLQHRHQLAKNKNEQLTQQTITLTAKIHQLILAKMQLFFSEQQQLLQHHILVTKRAMAKVIEAGKVRQKAHVIDGQKAEVLL